MGERTTYRTAGVRGSAVVGRACTSGGIATPGIAYIVDTILLDQGTRLHCGGSEAQKRNDVEEHFKVAQGERYGS